MTANQQRRSRSRLVQPRKARRAAEPSAPVETNATTPASASPGPLAPSDAAPPIQQEQVAPAVQRAPAAPVRAAQAPAGSSRPATVPPQRTPARPKQPWRTQIVSRRLVANLYTSFLWLVCAGLFAITALGNIGFFGADVTRLLDAPYKENATWYWMWIVPMNVQRALIAGCVMQLGVQVCQFATAHQKRSTAYRSWLAASVIPSTWTYAPLAIGLMATKELWGSLASIVALIVIVLVVGFCTIVDMSQERILLNDD